MSFVEYLLYPSEIVPPYQRSVYHPPLALRKFIDHWNELCHWTHEDHNTLTAIFPLTIWLLFACLVLECRRHVHEGIEVPKPRALRELSDDENPSLIYDVDLVLDWEVDVLHGPDASLRLVEELLFDDALTGPAL